MKQKKSKRIFFVFISDKIWYRYTRRPHYSNFAKLGDLVIFEMPLVLFSKEFLKNPIKELKYYFKYSFGKRIDKFSGAKLIRPILLFPSTVKNTVCKGINRRICYWFYYSFWKDRGNEIVFLTNYQQEWLLSKHKKEKNYVLEMNDEWSMISYDEKRKDKIYDSTINILQRVDILITVTNKLKTKYGRFCDSYYLPNAVDIDHYVPDFETKVLRKTETQLDYDKDFLQIGNNDPRKYLGSVDILKNISKPAVGSISGLSGNWSDFEFMSQVEEILPKEYFLISSGNIFPPSKEEFKAGYDKYMTNIRMKFLGHLDYSILPDFLKKINVGIVMHRMDEFNKHSAPNKIWAYLAMGLPVVSTNFLEEEDKEIFNGLVGFARTPDEYVDMIIRAIETDSPALKIKRRELAVNNSTLNRAKRIADIIENKFS